MIIDYKMKLELGKRTREIQRDWYGKRGISLHGCYVIAQVGETKSSEVFDLWSEDTKQDAFFTQGALDVCFTWLERTFSGFAVYLFSGMNAYFSFCAQKTNPFIFRLPKNKQLFTFDQCRYGCSCFRL